MITPKPGTWFCRNKNNSWRWFEKEPFTYFSAWACVTGEFCEIPEELFDLTSIPTYYEKDWRKTKWQVPGSPLPCEVELIKQVNESEDIGPLEDGFQYYFPSVGGGMSAWQLRAIADELDKRNADWERTIAVDMAKQKETESQS